MGNIAQFGWSSGHCRRSSIGASSVGDGSGDMDNIGGGGVVVNDSSSSSSSTNNANANANKTGTQRPTSTAATIGAATHTAALGGANPEPHQMVEHRARSASKLPAHRSDNDPGTALAGVGTEIVAAFRYGAASREGSSGVLTAGGGGRRAGWGSPPGLVSPRAPSPDERAQPLCPVPVRAGLSPNLRIDVDHGGGDAGGASSYESQSTPGM